MNAFLSMARRLEEFVLFLLVLGWDGAIKLAGVRRLCLICKIDTPRLCFCLVSWFELVFGSA